MEGIRIKMKVRGVRVWSNRLKESIKYISSNNALYVVKPQHLHKRPSLKLLKVLSLDLKHWWVFFFQNKYILPEKKFPQTEQIDLILSVTRKCMLKTTTRITNEQRLK